MDWITRAWEWFNGKKSTIGGVLLWLGYTGIPYLTSQGFDPVWLNYVMDFFVWFGQILLPVGLAHKYVKVKKK